MCVSLASISKRSLLILSVVMFAPGCGPSEQQLAPTDKIVEVTPTDNVRSFLESLAVSGELDSGAIVLKDNIAAMKAAGTEVGDLEQDADQLLGMSNPTQIKAKAKEMLDKLPK